MNNIGFLFPWALLLLLMLPLLVWLYWRGINEPKSQAAVYHPDLALLREAARRGRVWSQHLPALVYGLAVTLALVAIARPTAPLPVLDNKTTVMLALDVSRSMDADDIPPTRLVAAQSAAKIFIKQLPGDMKVGLVSFAGEANLEVAPTNDHQQVLEAIENLQLDLGTAIGAGLEEAVNALPGRGLFEAPKDPKAIANLPPASIVLLSDGRNNRPQIDPLEAAERAKQLGVKVYTVGLGTDNGYLPSRENGIGGFVVGFDAETLKAIARITGGEYFEAKSAGQLDSVYRNLSRSIGWSFKPDEVTGIMAALAAVVALLAIFWSQWQRKVI
jgi:Ca-activated chloride channel homolog